nr:bifunctional pyr operon transcriptional regulator/uracil phosphoribosyltransferase PyrR [uncultured Brachyspira sp.]
MLIFLLLIVIIHNVFHLQGEIKMRVLLKAEEYQKVLPRLAAEIIEKEDVEKLTIVGIRRRGDFLAIRLKKLLQEKINIDIPIGAIDINLYRDDLSSLSEFPEIKETDIPFDITGKTVLLVDDVLYTGRTIRAALNALFEYGRPKKVSLLVLVDRFGRELPVSANYVGLALNVPQDQYVSVRIKELEGEDLVLLKDKN